MVLVLDKKKKKNVFPFLGGPCYLHAVQSFEEHPQVLSVSLFHNQARINFSGLMEVHVLTDRVCL